MPQVEALLPPILFCCTNIDLYSYDEFAALERLGLAVDVLHCLGLCHYCTQGKMAFVADTVIVAADAAAFWQAVQQHLALGALD